MTEHLKGKIFLFIVGDNCPRKKKQQQIFNYNSHGESLICGQSPNAEQLDVKYL
jgi:hypothetical protein